MEPSSRTLKPAAPEEGEATEVDEPQEVAPPVAKAKAKGKGKGKGKGAGPAIEPVATGKGKKAPSLYAQLVKFRTALEKGTDRAKIEAEFHKLFPPKLWKSYQHQFNAAERTKLNLPNDVVLKIPTPAQKFWADVGNPALGMRGAIIIAPTGTGKSDMIGLIAENNKHYNATIDPPVPGAEPVGHQVFVVTRASLKRDLESKAAGAMETRQLTELEDNIRRFTKLGESPYSKKSNFNPTTNIMSYKRFANLLQGKNKEGRELWAGIAYNKNLSFKPTEGYIAPKITSAENIQLQASFGYNSLPKTWSLEWKRVAPVRGKSSEENVEARFRKIQKQRNLEIISTVALGEKPIKLPNGWKLTMDYGRTLNPGEYDKEWRKLNDFLMQLHLRRQMPLVEVDTLPKTGPDTKRAEKEIARFWLKTDTPTVELDHELEDVLDGKGEIWIKGMKVDNKQKVGSPAEFVLTFALEGGETANYPDDLTEKEERDFADTLLGRINEKVDADLQRFTALQNKYPDIVFPYFRIRSIEEGSEVYVTTAKGWPELQIAARVDNQQLTTTADVFTAYLFEPVEGQPSNPYQNIFVDNDVETIEKWSESVKLSTFQLPERWQPKFDILPHKKDEPVEKKERTPLLLDADAPDNFRQRNAMKLAQNYGHSYYTEDDKHVGIQLADNEPETFHWLDNCTVIFDEAHLFVDKNALKASESVDSALILQAISDADCSAYFFSATMPFLTGLAFIEALQPSIYLKRRLGKNVRTVPSSPLLTRHRKLLDIDSMTQQDKQEIFSELFVPDAVEPLKYLTPEGKELVARTFGNIGFSPPVEKQLDMFSRLEAGGITHFTFDPLHENYLRKVLAQRQSLFSNPSRLLEAINFCNQVDEPPENAPLDFNRDFVPFYSRVGSEDFSKEIGRISALFLGPSVPAMRPLLETIRKIDTENANKTQLGRIVVISHAKDDVRGIGLVATGLRLVGYNWVPIVMQELDKSERTERKEFLARNEITSLPNRLRYIRLADKRFESSGIDAQYGPVPVREAKRDFIVYSASVLGGPDGPGVVTVASLTERIKKSRYHTRYEGRGMKAAVRAGVLSYKPNETEATFDREKRTLIRSITGSVIYFWPGADHMLDAEKENSGRVSKINELFGKRKDWFFFVLRLDDEESRVGYKELEFPWLPKLKPAQMRGEKGDKQLNEMRKFFTIDKVDSKMREEMSELYKSETNEPAEKTVNNIGLVLVGSDFLSGIDIYGATSVIKFDVPPTHNVAVQGTGRANRRGGLSQFPFNEWILKEYLLVPQWTDPPKGARREKILRIIKEKVGDNATLTARSNRQRGLVKRYEDLEEKIEDLEAENRARFTEIRKKKLDIFKKELKQLKVEYQDLQKTELSLSVLNQQLQGIRSAVLTNLYSFDGPDNLKNRPQDLSATTLRIEEFNKMILQPHEVVRQLMYKDELSEAYNQLGQGKFQEWAIDYTHYIKPQELSSPDQKEKIRDAEKLFAPTGFYLSWNSFLAKYQPAITDETSRKELEEDLADAVKRNRVLAIAMFEEKLKNLPPPGNVDRWNSAIQALQKGKESAQSLAKIQKFLDEQYSTALTPEAKKALLNSSLQLIADTFVSYKERNGTVFSEILRDPISSIQKTPRLYCRLSRYGLEVNEEKGLIDKEESIILPLVSTELFSGTAIDEEKLLHFLVDSGIAVWQIRLPITTVTKADAILVVEEAKEQPEELPKKTRKRKVEKTEKPASSTPKRPKALEARLEPFRVFGKDDTPSERIHPDFKDVTFESSAFNAFFDLRILDKEARSIQIDLTEKATKLFNDLGLAADVEDIYVNPESLAKLFPLIKDDYRGKQLRTSFGILFIDGMLDWNLAAPFFYHVCVGLQARNPTIGQDECASFAGLIYRNAVQADDFVKLSNLCLPDSEPNIGALEKLLYMAATIQIRTPVNHFDAKEEDLGTVLHFVCKELNVDFAKSKMLDLLQIAKPARGSLSETELPEVASPFNRINVLNYIRDNAKGFVSSFETKDWLRLQDLVPDTPDFQNAIANAKLRKRDPRLRSFLKKYNNSEMGPYVDMDFPEALDKWMETPNGIVYLSEETRNIVQNWREKLIDYKNTGRPWQDDLNKQLQSEDATPLPFRRNGQAVYEMLRGGRIRRLEDQIGVDMSLEEIYTGTGVKFETADETLFNVEPWMTFKDACINRLDIPIKSQDVFAVWIENNEHFYWLINGRTWVEVKEVLDKVIFPFISVAETSKINEWLKLSHDRLMNIQHFFQITFGKKFNWPRCVTVPKAKDDDAKLAKKYWNLKGDDLQEMTDDDNQLFAKFDIYRRVLYSGATKKYINNALEAIFVGKALDNRKGLTVRLLDAFNEGIQADLLQIENQLLSELQKTYPPMKPKGGGKKSKKSKEGEEPLPDAMDLDRKLPAQVLCMTCIQPNNLCKCKK